MKSIRLSFIGLLLLAIIVSCSSDSPNEPIVLEECNTDVMIKVSSGTTPTFTWEPICKVSWLLVEEGSSDQWFISNPDSNTIAPGVVYGIVPESANENSEAKPLVKGTTYEVILFWRTGPDYDIGEDLLIQTFTP